MFITVNLTMGRAEDADLLLLALGSLGLLLGLLGRAQASLGLHGVQVRLLGMRQRLQSLVMVILKHRHTGQTMLNE